MPTAVEVFAPAKVNLALHVTGQRKDGYHLLDTLVAFGSVGDRLRLQIAETTSLHIKGPFATNLRSDENNLVLRALRIVAPQHGFAVTLEKYLPVAAGIGGGSADAAAAARAARHLVDKAVAQDNLTNSSGAAGPRHFCDELKSLGADVPMCLEAHSCRARGIGDETEQVDLPPVAAVLINPGFAVATPDIFRKLEDRNNMPLPKIIPSFAHAPELIDWLRDQRNDLATAAIESYPEIGGVIGALNAQAGCGMAAMSGSGATCFGLFADIGLAKRAANVVRDKQPNWWVEDCVLGIETKRVTPIVISGDT